MIKFKFFGVVLCLFVLCSCSPQAWNIPHCLDAYMYVDGECVPRPAHIPPKWPDNSKTYVVKWYEEHYPKQQQQMKPQEKKPQTKKKKKLNMVPTVWKIDENGKKKCDTTGLKPGESMDCGTMIVTNNNEPKKVEKKKGKWQGKIKWETGIDAIKNARAKNESYMLVFYFLEDVKARHKPTLKLFRQLHMVGAHINHYWHPILVGMKREHKENIEKVFGEMEYPVARFFDYEGNNISNLTSIADDETFAKAYIKTWEKLRGK